MQITVEEIRHTWKVRRFRVLRMVAQLSAYGDKVSVHNVWDGLLQKYEKEPCDLPLQTVQDDIRFLTSASLIDQGTEKRESLSMTPSGNDIIARMATRSKEDPANYGRYMAEKSSSPSRRRGMLGRPALAA